MVTTQRETEALLNVMEEITSFTQKNLIKGEFFQQLGLRPESLSFVARLEKQELQNYPGRLK